MPTTAIVEGVPRMDSALAGYLDGNSSKKTNAGNMTANRLETLLFEGNNHSLFTVWREGRMWPGRRRRDGRRRTNGEILL